MLRAAVRGATGMACCSGANCSQACCRRGSSCASVPPPWLKAMRRRGWRASVPPVNSDAAASPTSPGKASACSKMGGPTSLSMPTGRSACTKMAAPQRSAAAKNGSKRASPMLTPSMLLPISTPARPHWCTAWSSSSIARSTSCKGTAPRPTKRAGACCTMPAMRSFKKRVSTCASAPSSQYDSSSGMGDSTCWPTCMASMSARRTWQSQHWCDTVR